jgi:hypothetical protein
MALVEDETEHVQHGTEARAALFERGHGEP